MSDLFLDLRDKPRVIDFMVDVAEYAGPAERFKAEKIVAAYSDGEHIGTDKLANDARTLAISTYPARYALRHFVSGAGASEEWKKLFAALRPSTAAILKRFKNASNASTIDEVLSHAESDVALRDEERSEIDHVREHVQHDLWHEKGESLDEFRLQGERELTKYLGRLKSLRDLAVELPASIQDEVFSKIASYEDKIFFAGGSVSSEILDEEVRFYTDQKEIDPL